MRAENVPINAMICRIEPFRYPSASNLWRTTKGSWHVFAVAWGWLWVGMDLKSQETSPPDSIEIQIESLKIQQDASVGFTLRTPEHTGLTFSNDLDERRGAANRVLFNGSGVAVGDVDGDGLPDLFFCGIDSPNHFYRNLGDLKFNRVNIPESMASPGVPSRGAVMVDLNGDGRLDLLISTVGLGVKVWLNEGAFQFTDSTDHAGTQTTYASTSMALADVDGNGTLDLYVTNNRSDDIRDRARVPITRVGGKILPPEDLRDRVFVHQGQLHEYGEPDQLYLNDGKGKMSAVSWTDGTFRINGHPLSDTPKDWGLSAMFRDFNHDGHPDLYVCNDYWTPDRIWINNGQGGFDAAPADVFPVTSASSMGIDGADVDADGDLDLLVVDMLSRDPARRKSQQPAVNMVTNIPSLNGPYRQENWNTLLIQRENGRFSDLAHFAGLQASDWSWCPVFMDVDLDGYQDVLISAGYPHDMQDMDTLRQIQSRQHDWDRYQNEDARQKAFTQEMMEHIRLYPKLDMPIVSFRNRGNGFFEETTDQWGTHHPGVHQGFATGDLDGDGDLDLVVNNLNAPAELYRNDSTQPRVLIRLTDRTSNHQAIGTQLELEQSSMPQQSREIIGGGRYLSGSSTDIVFAIAPKDAKKILKITWRDGSETSIPNIQSNHRYLIQRVETPHQQPSSSSKSKPDIAPMFVDASEKLRHRAEVSPSNDQLKQPLLPWSLSFQGPSLVCSDLNSDDRPDIVIGAEHTHKPIVFQAQPDGTFTSTDLNINLWNDASGMLALPIAPNSTHLLMGLNGYESQDRPALTEHNLKGQHRSLYSNRMFGAGPMAAGALSGEGGLSVFIGGHAVSGNYPTSHPSLMVRQTQGGWMIDEANTSAVQSIALPQSAVWSDLTADGYPELIVTSEWGPVHVFENVTGKLVERTKDWGFADMTGLWKGVTTGDFDGNGLLDIVVGNWGLNSPWKATAQQPLKMYYGAWTRPGRFDLLETEYHPDGTLAPLRSLAEVGQALPFLFSGLSGFKDYGNRSVEELLGDKMANTQIMAATTLESMVFLNQGGGNFHHIPLPTVAQQAPVYGFQSGDLDMDGHVDLILGQNTSHTRPGFPQQTSGSCRVLLGNGDGTFSVSGIRETGIDIRGDMRAIALGDLNQDHRMDVLITQNENATKLYLNHSNTPEGTAITFEASKENPQGIGVQYQFQYTDGTSGPIHEITAGSGWLAQNQPIGLLAGSSEPKVLFIRWPGGKTQQYPWADLPKSIRIKASNLPDRP